MLTPPFALPAGDLHLNVDARGGSCTAALSDEQGRPLAGFEESAPISGDQLDAVAAGPDADSAGVGRRVTLRLTLRRARVYSYWFE